MTEMKSALNDPDDLDFHVMDGEEDEEMGEESQTASTSLTACGCASRAGVSEFSVSTDGSTCACDPDGVERPMSAGGEFCACANSQTASADEHNECRPNEFCRNPLHPGPCKGWKKKRVSNGGGSGKSSSDRSGGDGGGTGPTGRLGPDTVAGRAYRIRRARNQSAVRAALEGASREDLLDVAEELGLGRPNNWTNERIIEEIVNESGAPEDSQTAAVRSDFDDLPIASRDMAWDVGEAEAAISRWATDADGDIDFNKYGRAFLYRDPEVSPRTKGAYKFPVATVLGGELTIVPHAVFAAAGRLDQAHVSGAAREMLRVAITDLYDQMAEEFDDDSLEAPWEMAADEYDELEHDLDASGDSAVDAYGADVHGGEFCGTCGGDPLDQVAAAYGVFGDIPPHPIEKFQRVASGPTPMTVLEDGSVFGHIAAWDSCNRGVRGRCVPPPKSKTNYAQFHTTPIRTTEGTLRVGKIVMGEGHADVNGNMQVTRAWYDKAGKTAAHGRAHEDQWGVFFSGVIGPNLTPADVVEFFSMPPSGHWTEHRPTRSSELIAVAAVNVPGHPIGAPDLVLNQVASGYYEPEDVEPMPVEDAASIFHILDRADWNAEAATLAGNLF